MAPTMDPDMAEITPWLTPDWPAPVGVHAACTLREGGVSQVPWDSLNLGDHVGDAPEHVRQNRQRLTQWIAARTPGACQAFLQQVHGTDVLELDAGNVGTANGARYDACVTADAGVVCTIMVADCLPVLLAHRGGKVVGAAHAGWRGLAGLPPGRDTGAGPLAQGVLESLFEVFCQKVQTVALPDAIKIEAIPAKAAEIASQTMAWLGPCIGPESFEVGEEVREVFVAHDARAARFFVPLPGEGRTRRYLADLPQLARHRLQTMGIAAIYGNDGSAPWCTVRNASRFFSHRRDAGRLGSSGRMAACIWRDGD
jgi:copper oxidase (laccase) domain-containing protein